MNMSRKLSFLKVESTDTVGRVPAWRKFYEPSQVRINTIGFSAGACIGVVAGEFGSEVFSFIKI